MSTPKRQGQFTYHSVTLIIIRVTEWYVNCPITDYNLECVTSWALSYILLLDFFLIYM